MTRRHKTLNYNGDILQKFVEHDNKVFKHNYTSDSSLLRDTNLQYISFDPKTVLCNEIHLSYLIPPFKETNIHYNQINNRLQKVYCKILSIKYNLFLALISLKSTYYLSTLIRFDNISCQTLILCMYFS